MARDRPSPYGEGDCFFTVARGPVPRDRCVARDRPAPYGIRYGFSMARDRPSPYGEGDCFFYRSAGALGCHTRIRAGFPRDRCVARDRPAPYGIRYGFSMARACPAPYGI